MATKSNDSDKAVILEGLRMLAASLKRRVIAEVDPSVKEIWQKKYDEAIAVSSRVRV